MGVSIGQPIHYPNPGSDQCRAAWILHDNPSTDFTVVDVIAASVSGGVVTWTPHAGVNRELAPAIPPTPGLWHYPDACPYGRN